ncbi:hypothetical protein PMG11_08398 [Penicillium brasilianum]|uniref:Uncharacterized protein n=1 Tax=Penicillium brasilianum TaxID=104259 RepID=A0A0F7TVB9_PENBI|nr:hypothetical protein PMG11_08398 [Penicillium brasilianum]
MIGVNQELTAERHDPLESSCEAMLTMSRYISSLVNGQDASRRRLVLQLSPAYQVTIQQYEGRPIIITTYGSLSRPRSPFSVLRTVHPSGQATTTSLLSPRDISPISDPIQSKKPRMISPKKQETMRPGEIRSRLTTPSLEIHMRSWCLPGRVSSGKSGDTIWAWIPSIPVSQYTANSCQSIRPSSKRVCGRVETHQKPQAIHPRSGIGAYQPIDHG